MAIAWGLAAALGSPVELGSTEDNGSDGKIIQYVRVGLLAASMARNWFGRATAEPPKWLGTLMAADPRRAFKVGPLVILLMPSDILIMLTVGVHLERSNSGYAHAFPFVALTVLVAAIPFFQPGSCSTGGPNPPRRRCGSGSALTAGSSTSSPARSSSS
ncbi:GAP family protein [Streptomyces sp. NPDC006365]|uniref:GAP family protein n=1 Tax=Streptomyces sp. NPDC006365 TaxID=3364744 RepID=UPI003679DE89